MSRTTKATLNDGYLNGRERGTRRKERKEQVRLKVWLLPVKKKLRMCIPLALVRAIERLLGMLRRRKDDLDGL